MKNKKIVIIFSIIFLFSISIAFAAQRYVLPMKDGAGSLGDESKQWGKLFVKQINPFGKSFNLDRESDSTAAAPALSFGDGDTGFYESSSNVISVTQNGSVTAGWGAGTAASPTIFFGDGNTGFYEITDNVLVFSRAGSEQF